MKSLRTLLCALIFVSGCDSCSKKNDAKSTPETDAAPAYVTVNLSPSVAPSANPVPVGGFKKFFPKEEGGYTRVMTSEKEGFAEANLLKDGKDVAILTIVDANKLAYAKAKFEGSTEKLGDLPVLKIGGNQSSVLVKDRFQVKVTSQTLDHEARKAIIAMFDLKGLGS